MLGNISPAVARWRRADSHVALAAADWPEASAGASSTALDVIGWLAHSRATPPDD
jgi:hypothetical protein